MIILVADTSVLIYLERANLLEAAFTVGLTMVVPDLLYQRELVSQNGPYLRSLGLGVVALTPQELSDAQGIKAQRSALSLPDCFALVCSSRQGHCLVSGDSALSGEAEARAVTVFGFLWLLDRLEERGTAIAMLEVGLTNLANHPRCRLPRNEVEERLARWRAHLNA